MFDDSVGNLGNLLQGIGALGLVLVGALTAYFGVKGYREKTQVEKAKWLSDLFRQFFVDRTFKAIRQRIDFDDLEPIRDLIAKEMVWHHHKAPVAFSESERNLLDAFTDYLNFFEFVGLLQRNGRLTDDDIEWLFDYYIKRLVEVDTDNQIRLYLKSLNFQNFDHLLNRAANYLFVYGTLKRGYARHNLIYKNGFEFVGTTQVPGILYCIPDQGYPGAKFGSTSNTVEGELYRIPFNKNDALNDIDSEEGVSEGLFARRLIAINIGGHAYASWAYSYMKEVNVDDEIPSGVFGDVSQKKKNDL